MQSNTMKRLTVQGYSRHGKPARITLRFDDKGKLLNPRSAAASSMIGWGEWQQSRKVPCNWGNCWRVNTAGHGGYILVTPIKGLPFKEPALKVEHAFGTVYVYEFEEDCDWAILEYHDPLVRQARVKELRARGTNVSEQEYIDTSIRPCLSGYNSWVFANNPMSAT